MLNKLDFDKGRVNAYFEIIVNKEDRNKIELLRFNFRDLYYTLQKNNNVMFKGNVNDPWSHLNKKRGKEFRKEIDFIYYE